MTDGAIAEKVIAARRRFPYLGPRKLLFVLERERPGITWPAASTIGEILKRAGLVTAIKRRRRPIDQRRPCTPARSANDEWATDFKGWFRTLDQQRIDPLTVTDSHTRFLIELRIAKPTIEGVRPCFERAFAEYGLPLAIRCDNGAPFGSQGAGGLTKLSGWWLKLGVEPHFIRPASPQENGRHERMHRTLKDRRHDLRHKMRPSSSCALMPFASITTRNVRMRRSAKVRRQRLHPFTTCSATSCRGPMV